MIGINSRYLSGCRLWIVSAALGAGLLSCSENSSNIPDETDGPATEDNWHLKENAFSYRLTTYLGSQLWNAVSDMTELENQNVVFSPIGIEMGFSMLANGADGATRTSLESLLLPQEPDLNIYTSLEDLNRYNQMFMGELESADILSKIRVENGLWHDGSITLNPDFATAITTHYGRIFSGDNPITDFNDWTSGFGTENIPGIISDESSASIIIGNAFTFSSPVSQQFYEIDSGSFVNSDGEESEVEMLMGVFSGIPWTKTTTAEIIWIPLGEAGYNEGLHLVVAIPNEGAEVSLSNVFDGEYVEGDSPYFSATYNVTLKIPKLSVESTLDIKDLSYGLGIDDVLDSSTNFSAMVTNGNPAFEKLLHTGIFKLNDNGPESSQFFTGISSSRAGDVVSGKKEITVTSSFAFMVLNNNRILIMGKICNL